MLLEGLESVKVTKTVPSIGVTVLPPSVPPVEPPSPVALLSPNTLTTPEV